MYQDASQSPELHVLLARGRDLEEMPLAEWQSSVRRGVDQMQQRLAFMSPEHHAVRNFAVTGLARLGRPLPVQEIANQVRMPESRAQEIVEELERRLFFLVRNTDGDVAWAFPVTAEATAHAMECNTGGRILEPARKTPLRQLSFSGVCFAVNCAWRSGRSVDHRAVLCISRSRATCRGAR